MFTPRPPLPYAEPTDYPPGERHTAHITPVSDFLEKFKEYKETDNYVPTESWLQKQQRAKKEKQQKNKEQLAAAIESWDPHSDPQVRGDPYKTLFVGRLDYSVTESDLEKEFVRYGPIEKIRVVRDTETEKSRGYAFIVFERERDLRTACNEAMDLVIKGRKVIVDVERGRVSKRWRPRKLGGGYGGRHYTRKEMFRAINDEYGSGSSRGKDGDRDRKGPRGSRMGGSRGAPGKGHRDRSDYRDRKRDGGKYRDRSPRRSHH